MDKIRTKIEKLLSLATSPNENEARAALLKAKQLMAENKLTEADFIEKKKSELVHKTCNNIKWTTDSGAVWMVELVNVLTKNYCCAGAWNTRKGTRTHTLVLTGFEEDVEVCSAVIEFAVNFVQNQIKIEQRRRFKFDPKSVAMSYAKGFSLGVEEAFYQQTQEHEEWGLVVQVPTEVLDYTKSLSSRSVRTKQTGMCAEAYGAGFEKGKQFNPQAVLV